MNQLAIKWKEGGTSDQAISILFHWSIPMRRSDIWWASPPGVGPTTEDGSIMKHQFQAFPTFLSFSPLTCCTYCLSLFSFCPTFWPNSAYFFLIICIFIMYFLFVLLCTKARVFWHTWLLLFPLCTTCPTHLSGFQRKKASYSTIGRSLYPLFGGISPMSLPSLHTKSK